MEKSLILVIILFILLMVVATNNTEPIQNTLGSLKTIIQGESNQEPIANISNISINTNDTNNMTNTTNVDNSINSNNRDDGSIINNLKTYNKNGIYFQYPSYWNYNQLNKLISLYQKEHLSRWDDGMIFYITDNPLEKELKIQQEQERYKHPKNITVDGRKAYSLSATKRDYWHYLILVEKNNDQTYVFIFYTDQDLKKENKVMFDQILSTMRLN